MQEQYHINMDLTQLINHPEKMDKETLYDLRSLVALYPYYQPARLLMLHNLYILHDPAFDEELRRSAIYLTNRKVLFDMVEASHYRLKTEGKHKKVEEKVENDENRTIALIDDFLESIPEEVEEKKNSTRKPTPADAAVDYVAYLLEIENSMENQDEEIPQLQGQDLIDNFIYKEQGRIQLKDELEYLPQMELKEDATEEAENESYCTETMAKIYIKQGRYEKALEIIQRLYLNYPKKNAYFADQMRFLEKLIINNKK